MKSSSYVASWILALSVTVATLARAEDSGAPEKPLQWLWLDGQAGYAVANLRTFNADSETLGVGIVPTSGSGPTFGIGAGVRLVFVTLGLRARVASFRGNTETGDSQAWKLWSLDAEVGVRVPLNRIEPHFTLGLGYTSLGAFGDAVDGLKGGLAVGGANVRIGAGVDYFLTRNFSLGVDLTGELLVLARKGVSLESLAAAKRVGSVDDAQARVLQSSGSSVGTLVSLTGGAALHF